MCPPCRVNACPRLPPPIDNSRAYLLHLQANDLRCPYSVLGVNPGASEKEVKAAYRQLAKAVRLGLVKQLKRGFDLGSVYLCGFWPPTTELSIVGMTLPASAATVGGKHCCIMHLT
jgi:hypothetical protein